MSKAVADASGSIDKMDSTSPADPEPGESIMDARRIDHVYRKLDLRIIPAFWTLYFLCSAIRSNVGLAQTMNIDNGHDLGLLRLLLGVVIAGMWPGMSYYLTLFYPPSRTGKRIGYYFTAAQLSAAVVGLVSAGFQKMDGLQGLVGFQWMFLLYGIIGICCGISLLWWLPDRPTVPGDENRHVSKFWPKWLPKSSPALSGEDARIHYEDLTRVYHSRAWGWKDLLYVLLDWRLWPLVVMYFGVVGVGIGVQNYGTVIIRGTNPELSGIELSLLFAPIWIMDLIAILLVTPLSDRFHHHRALFFSVPVLLQILGLLLTTYAGSVPTKADPSANPWPRYGGLLIVGFGLGPTVPITMTWTNEIFQPRHGEVGVAAASALVSGLGNLGSILTTYALYEGWASDRQPGPKQYRKSNLVMVGILCASILASALNTILLKWFGHKGITPKKVSSSSSVSGADAGVPMDGAARREIQERGLGRLWWSKKG
ncbi:MAG: hypothetical protein Q9160_005887 [Pyrenula sp. 1 TL-2023]